MTTLLRYTILDRVIGSGTNNEAITAIDNRSGSPCVALIGRDQSEDGRKYAMRVAQLWDDVNGHPHAAHKRGTFQTAHRKGIICDRYDTDLLDVADKTRISLRKSASFGLQILEFLSFAHSKKWIHGDLKLENIFLNKVTEVIAVGDFGAASIQGNCDHEVQTPYIMSPEICLMEKNFTTAIDIWSFACCLFQMFTGEQLLELNEDADPFTSILQHCGFPSKEYLDRFPGWGKYFMKTSDGNYLPKVYVKPNPDWWRNTVRNTGIANSEDPKLVELFIDMLAECLKYENRISADEIISSKKFAPLFEINRCLKIQSEYKGTLHICNQNDENNGVKIPLSSTSPQHKCLHLPAYPVFRMRVSKLEPKHGMVIPEDSVVMDYPNLILSPQTVVKISDKGIEFLKPASI